jgi:hypothetical protein
MPTMLQLQPKFTSGRKSCGYCRKGSPSCTAHTYVVWVARVNKLVRYNCPGY